MKVANIESERERDKEHERVEGKGYRNEKAERDNLYTEAAFYKFLFHCGKLTILLNFWYEISHSDTLCLDIETREGSPR